MMLPNQITSNNFSQTGKGGYKAVEVDAFIQRVYQSYNKLYNDNKALCEKLDESLPMLEEYNRMKNSIAEALICAKSTAEKSLSEAQQIAEKLVAEATEKADRILEDKISQADEYYEKKTAYADAGVKNAEKNLADLKSRAESFSEEYTLQINDKIKAMIDDANAKASEIVAKAYADAESANAKAAKIIDDANKELNKLKTEAMKIKNELLSLVVNAQSAADKVESRFFEAIENSPEADEELISAQQIDIDEIESFEFDELDISQVNTEAAEPEENEDEEQPSFVRFFDTKLPDVEELFSGIFTPAGDKGSKSNPEEEENSFRFNNIFADPVDRGDTRPFTPLKKESE